MHFPNRPLPLALVDAANRADATRGYTFVAEDGVTETFYSFTHLGEEVARRGAALLRLGLLPGERVAMIIPEGDDFVLTFLGAMHVGLVPVPMCPPMTLGKLGNFLDTAKHIIRKSESAGLVCSAQVLNVLGSLVDSQLRVVVASEQLPLDDTQAPIANLTADHPAFIQFTSGSTSKPKGVVLTHGNLAANAHCIMNLGLQATPDDVGCSWLPFYHDMGLIGFVLAPIVTDTPVAFMQPLAFIKRPAQWLHMITRHKGTIGFGPNFAYGLCASRIKDRHLEGVDLSSWRVAGCGAEPIQLDVLQKFADRFDDYGFRAEAFMPCFGMAESTLAVTFHDLGEKPRADRVCLESLTKEHVAVPVTEDHDGETASFVCCGRPFPGHDLGIQGEDGTLLGDRAVGEIVIKGPSVMNGYFKDDDTTGRTIDADGWLHTGDKGYVADGELYVCGRIKEMIIVAGRNYYPTDLEWACNEIPGVRKGNIIAFSVGDFGEQERVIVTVESKADPDDYDRIRKDIKAKVLSTVGLKVSEVVVLEPGSLPKTSSGKLQRSKTKQMYLDGALEGAHRGDGRLGLVTHLAKSQWGLLKHRVRSTFTSSRPSAR